MSTIIRLCIGVALLLHESLNFTITGFAVVMYCGMSLISVETKLSMFSGRPRSYDIYPTGRIFNAAPSDSTAMYFSYETNTPLTSHTNWSFVNASRSTAEFPLDSDAFKYYSRIALYFVLGSPSLYGSYSATINNSYGSTTEMFWVLSPGI